MKILLYTTGGCHLCEQALELLIECQRAGHRFDICEVEIADSESLIDAYGIRIPVIRIDGREPELGWPFDREGLEQFLTDY